jgi:hypothetical protein
MMNTTRRLSLNFRALGHSVAAMKSSRRWALSITVLALLLSVRANAQEHEKVAPYPAVRWVPEVRIGERWYALLQINRIPVERIVEFSREKYESRWAKRFEEDLVQVLTGMGHAPGEAVDLVARDLETGQVKTLERVPLTRENREMLMAGKVDLAAALGHAQGLLADRWSYRRANDADFDAALARLREKLAKGMKTVDFGMELQRILAMGIDGHAEVLGFELRSQGNLPFLIEPEGDGFVAFTPDRRGFLAPEMPYVTKMDGKDVAVWCDAAAALVSKGSPQYVRRQALRHVRALDAVRGMLGIAVRETVEVEVASADGKARRVLTMPVAARPPVYGRWPRTTSRLLNGNIGYLRLSEMDDDATAEIRAGMAKFRTADGLVIDVRDNGGGSREPLRVLYSYLAAPDAPPRVFTAAAYRLHPEHPRDHLAKRFMYRADAAEWRPAEREAVAAFARDFKPQWRLPDGQFSEWHYMVLTRDEADAGVFHFDKPAIILMNSKCFSATDLFLAGMKGMKGVTLMGTASAGGSGLADEVKLNGAPFGLRFSTIASFQAVGRLFVGIGVLPDVVLEASPGYYIGAEDNVLEAARNRVTSSRGGRQ